MLQDGPSAPHYSAVQRWLAEIGPSDVIDLKAKAAAHFRQIGITFAVHGADPDPERLIPFDPIPRLLTAAQWARIEAGCLQRAAALNAFIADVYGAKRILAEGLIPLDLVLNNPAYLKQMDGFAAPGNVWAHICGVDIVATGPDDFYVLEDNCRTPSGISYVLQTRNVMAKILPELMGAHRLRSVDAYPDQLLAAMRALAPPETMNKADPKCVVLTPGLYNSAYYEHSFIADRMGLDLVTGADLTVGNDDRAYVRTTSGLRPVDVIYRRIDDAFLDPEAFQSGSLIGVPGLMRAYRAGKVTLINAPGAGIADDKAIYTYVPEMIRLYLGEEPILPSVPTWRCAAPDQLAHVLEHLDTLVVKEVHGSGGSGMLVGPHASAEDRAAFEKRLRATPAKYIAQPTLSLSTAPTFDAAGHVVSRHLDLRPFVVTGERASLIPGGLTRVALKPGSLIVNSSQEGGVKDTWVLVD